MSVLPPDALQERLQALIRPGDTLWWGQATAEPLTLTRAVVAQRQALARHGGQGRLRVFVGMAHRTRCNRRMPTPSTSSAMRPAAPTAHWPRRACWTSCPATTPTCPA